MGEATEDARADTRWVSYAELAEARGISRESAIRIARRRRWPKREGNDGTVRVAVPRSVLDQRSAIRPDILEDSPGDIPPDISQKISALEAETANLREQVVELRVREGAALARADELRAMVERLTAVPGAAAWARVREVLGRWRAGSEK